MSTTAHILKRISLFLEILGITCLVALTVGCALFFNGTQEAESIVFVSGVVLLVLSLLIMALKWCPCFAVPLQEARPYCPHGGGGDCQRCDLQRAYCAALRDPPPKYRPEWGREWQQGREVDEGEGDKATENCDTTGKGSKNYFDEKGKTPRIKRLKSMLSKKESRQVKKSDVVIAIPEADDGLPSFRAALQLLDAAELERVSRELSPPFDVSQFVVAVDEDSREKSEGSFSVSVSAIAGVHSKCREKG